MPATAARRPGSPGYPVNLLVRGRRVVVVGGGRIAARKIEPLLELGARRGRGRAGGRRRGAGVGRRGPAARCIEREFRAGDLDGAWLALTATDDPGGQRGRVRRGRGGPGLGQQCRRPGQLLLYADVGDPACRPGRRASAPAAAARRSPRTSGGARTRSSALSTRSCSTCSPRPGKRCAASGRSTEDADWQRAFDSGIVDLVRAGPCRRGEGALELVSLIVVGLNHRTAPVELLERMTVPEEQLAKVLHDLARARAPARGRACCPRATASRSTRAARTSTPRSATCATSSPRTRAPTPTSSPTSSTRTTTKPRSRTCSRSRPASTR